MLNCQNKISHNDIGKNFSYIVMEKNHQCYIVLFDIDDGSGITECRNDKLDGDCKLNFKKLNNLIIKYNASKTLVFKSQLNLYDCDYYPFKKNIYPLGYYCDNQQFIFPTETLVKKDIDVLWIGTVNETGSPWNWPDGRDIKTWPSGIRKAGFNKLSEIKESRKDLKIICSSDKIPIHQYNELINRAKICLELPGCGLFTKRLVENIRRGKCILSLKQVQNLHFNYIQEQHYALIENNEFIDLERKIDNLLISPEILLSYENQSKNISKFFDYNFISDYIINLINKET